MNVVPTLMTISAAMPLTLVCGRAACVGQECLDTAGGLGSLPDNGGGGTAPVAVAQQMGGLGARPDNARTLITGARPSV